MKGRLLGMPVPYLSLCRPQAGSLEADAEQSSVAYNRSDTLLRTRQAIQKQTPILRSDYSGRKHFDRSHPQNMVPILAVPPQNGKQVDRLPYWQAAPGSTEWVYLKRACPTLRPDIAHLLGRLRASADDERGRQEFILLARNV
jgi:hypothetical protein